MKPVSMIFNDGELEAFRHEKKLTSKYVLRMLSTIDNVLGEMSDGSWWCGKNFNARQVLKEVAELKKFKEQQEQIAATKQNDTLILKDASFWKQAAFIFVLLLTYETMKMALDFTFGIFDSKAEPPTATSVQESQESSLQDRNYPLPHVPDYDSPEATFRPKHFVGTNFPLFPLICGQEVGEHASTQVLSDLFPNYAHHIGQPIHPPESKSEF